MLETKIIEHSIPMGNGVAKKSYSAQAQSSASPPHSAVWQICNKTDKTKEHETMKRVFSERTIVSKVRTILADVLMTDKRSIRREKTLVDDLGADSIDFVEIVMELEKAFGITIKDDEAEHLDEWTVGDLYKFVKGKL